MHPNCSKCNSRCCQYYCFQIDTPESYEDFENVRWYLCHEGTSVHIDHDDDWCILIENRCRMLEQTPEGERCRIYDNRPLVCRRFSPHSCEVTVGGHDYQQLFETPDQIEAYARQALGEEEFLRARAEGRARAERSCDSPDEQEPDVLEETESEEA